MEIFTFQSVVATFLIPRAKSLSICLLPNFPLNKVLQMGSNFEASTNLASFGYSGNQSTEQSIFQIASPAPACPSSAPRHTHSVLLLQDSLVGRRRARGHLRLLPLAALGDAGRTVALRAADVSLALAARRLHRVAARRRVRLRHPAELNLERRHFGCSLSETGGARRFACDLRLGFRGWRGGGGRTRVWGAGVA